MKKLKLNLESLRVDSFVADAKGENRGTVYANSQQTYGTFCWPYCGSGTGDNCEATLGTKPSECLDCTQ